MDGGPASVRSVDRPAAFTAWRSPSGSFIAAGHAIGTWKTILWDLHEKRRINEVDHAGTVRWVGFTADESAMVSIGQRQVGEIAVTPVDGTAPRIIAVGNFLDAAVYPAGGILVVSGGNPHRLSIVDLESGQVKQSLAPVKPAGTAEVTQLIAQSIQSETARIDMEAAAAKATALIATQIQKLAKLGVLPDQRAMDEAQEQMKRGHAEQMKRMSDQLAQIGTPDWLANIDLNPEMYYRLAFDRKGLHLMVATSQAVRVYRWDEIARATDHLPRPGFPYQTCQPRCPSEARR